MPTPPFRMTMATRETLRALLIDPGRRRYGLELCELASLPSGTVHPILARLEAVRWVESEWEDVDTRAAGRPRRRYYRLTKEGAELSRHALAQDHLARQARMRRAGHGGLAEGLS